MKIKYVIFTAIALTGMPLVAFSSDSKPIELRRLDDSDADAAKHQKVALAKAEHYYRYERLFGSHPVAVTGLEIEPDETKPVDGWTGRYRTSGKAIVEYYDPVTQIRSKSTYEFEVLTEQKDSGNIEVVNFIAK